jgi:hypothetical protein
MNCLPATGQRPDGAAVGIHRPPPGIGWQWFSAGRAMADRAAASGEFLVDEPVIANTGNTTPPPLTVHWRTA